MRPQASIAVAALAVALGCNSIVGNSVHDLAVDAGGNPDVGIGVDGAAASSRGGGGAAAGAGGHGSGAAGVGGTAGGALGGAAGGSPDAAADANTQGYDVAPDTVEPVDAGPRCVIDGTVVPGGTAHPSNACQTCQPSVSGSAWSNVSDGTPCGTGNVCKAGACSPGCYIDGSVRSPDATKSDNPCLSCRPAMASTTWSNVTDGTSCGNGQICGRGACGTQCFIGGTTFAAGASNPANACQICQPGTSITAWTTACGWQTGAFGACSTTCGAGTQTRPVTCVASNGTTLPDALCTDTKPATSQACNAATGCTWQTGAFGACSTTCGTGTQTRPVTCVASNGSTVPDALCTDTKPATSQACNATTGCTWQTGAFGACSTTCGTGVQTRQVVCSGPNMTTVADGFCLASRPVSSQSCVSQAGCSWTVGAWSGCSVRCGSGTMTRAVTCKDTAGTTVADTYCAASPPPKTQVCNGPACTVYVVGEPTAANGPCFKPGCTGPVPDFPPCPAGYVNVRSETACGDPNDCGGNWALCTFRQVTGYGCTGSGFSTRVAVRQCDYQ